MSELQRRLIPFVFVFIWSTGFIVARYGMPALMTALSRS